MAHFMGHEARGRRRWRGLTRHAWTKTVADCGHTSSLKQVEFFAATTVIYCGRCVAPRQPWLFCCMENINKPGSARLLNHYAPCQSAIGIALPFTKKKLNSRPFQNSKITSWTLWELVLVQQRQQPSRKKKKNAEKVQMGCNHFGHGSSCWCWSILSSLVLEKKNGIFFFFLWLHEWTFLKTELFFLRKSQQYIGYIIWVSLLNSHLNLLELLSSSGFPISTLTKHRYSH